MKVLVLGATGMIGHKMVQVLSRRHKATGTVRGDASLYEDHPVLGSIQLLSDVRADSFDTIIEATAQTRPDVLINCIGIIKQHPLANDPMRTIAINALFPHRLARLCQASGVRMIQISTDCVFSGKAGNYVEDDMPDPEDLYGRTKMLGEVASDGCLTVRTSTVGRELKGRMGLVEWFLRQKDKKVTGFEGAIYTGLTTQVLAETITNIIEDHPGLSGLWHISSDPITKYELLNIANQEFGLGAEINRDGAYRCDRSLNSSRFREATGFKPPSWEEMIGKLADDPTPYDILN